MDVKKTFASTRTAVAAAVIAVAALIAYFAGLFPGWQVPVINQALAEQLINVLAMVGTALIVGFTVRNPKGGVDWMGVFNTLVEVLKVAGVIQTPPQEENK